MKTVVTGAAGFIGTNLVRALVREGRSVRAVDNESRGSSRNLEGLSIEVMRADLRSYDQSLLAVDGADVVYHLAARVGNIDFLHGNATAELESIQSNLVIDANVFRACKECGVSKIVYASSVSVYPVSKQHESGTRLAEDDMLPVDPDGGYGWAKLVGELQLGLMEGCRSSVARIFNCYGEYDEFGDSAHVVPTLIRKAICYPQEGFAVWGDGRQVRSFLFIEDCVSALASLEQYASYPPMTVNVGHPSGTSIGELAGLVAQTSGKDIEIEFVNSSLIGPENRIPNATRAKQVLGWEPKVTLADGLRRTYAWISRELSETALD